MSLMRSEISGSSESVMRRRLPGMGVRISRSVRTSVKARALPLLTLTTILRVSSSPSSVRVSSPPEQSALPAIPAQRLLTIEGSSCRRMPTGTLTTALRVVLAQVAMFMSWTP